ncbi:MAG: endonuclease/exonuclease/phosphatase family protein [Candidatus Marinimicrobia bacterium]|nr:endonuclease/exonuclease/phosphatase family protein [Candidatus Neomarinimicrobiota bacterium]
MELTWINPDIDNLTGVRIGKRIGEQEWNNNYAELPAGINNFIDSLILIPNLIVAYRIQAFSDNDSSDISQACAFFFPETAPSNISGRQIDTGNFLLHWSDNSIGEDYFVIDKKTGNNDWQKAYQLVEANQTEFIDNAGTSHDSIYYRISASVGISNSSLSSVIGLKISTLNLNNLYFGSDLTFDILTWNVQNFPRKNGDTIVNLAKAISALQVDIIALQEIESNSGFNTLIDSLNNYQGFKANSAYADLDLAYLYNTKYVTVDSVYEIYTREYSAFPRRPLVLHCRWQNIPVIIINNHFKCCGDGVINRNDEDDEEYRRYTASTLLATYIQNHFANDNVIIVGDFNDEITDNQNNNIFQPFIDQSDNFMIADMSIAKGSSTQWSYPTWPSHLDHIIISDELFDEFSESNTSVQTLLIDQYFSSGWNEYALNISDHRPVGLKFRFANTVY